MFTCLEHPVVVTFLVMTIGLYCQHTQLLGAWPWSSCFGTVESWARPSSLLLMTQLTLPQYLTMLHWAEPWTSNWLVLHKHEVSSQKKTVTISSIFTITKTYHLPWLFPHEWVQFAILNLLYLEHTWYFDEFPCKLLQGLWIALYMHLQFHNMNASLGKAKFQHLNKMFLLLWWNLFIFIYGANNSKNWSSRGLGLSRIFSLFPKLPF